MSTTERKSLFQKAKREILQHPRALLHGALLSVGLGVGLFGKGTDFKPFECAFKALAVVAVGTIGYRTQRQRDQTNNLGRLFQSSKKQASKQRYVDNAMTMLCAGGVIAAVLPLVAAVSPGFVVAPLVVAALDDIVKKTEVSIYEKKRREIYDRIRGKDTKSPQP